MLLANKAPAKIQEKAKSVLSQYGERKQFPSKTLYNSNLYFRVGLNWRLYSNDAGLTWSLMDYDHFLSKMEKDKRTKSNSR